MEKPKSIAELRKFIRSREMRYFAVTFSGQVHIRKAFKVEIDGGEYWIHFTADGTDVIPERNLVKTMKEAREEAQKLRDVRQQKKKEYGEKLKEVADFLDRYYWKGYSVEDFESRLSPDEQVLAREVRRLYNTMPKRERDDDRTYIELLENYIEYGTIYTQALSFRKEHVVCVKYGDKAVQIELTNGTKIVPKSESVTRLIETIFGDGIDDTYYKNIKSPAGDWDTIVTKAETERR